jgi:deoxycytidylate deaminase
LKAWVAEGRRKLRGSPLMDITEYGRAVHAEMEAILACARTGGNPSGATLYCTTSPPCHNCAKHIVDVGITRVVCNSGSKPRAGLLLARAEAWRTMGLDGPR